jgi:hypothetical protein
MYSYNIRERLSLSAKRVIADLRMVGKSLQSPLTTKSLRGLVTGFFVT